MEWMQEPEVNSNNENPQGISPFFICGNGYSGGFSDCPSKNGCGLKVCSSQGCGSYNCIILIG